MIESAFRLQEKQLSENVMLAFGIINDSYVREILGAHRDKRAAIRSGGRGVPGRPHAKGRGNGHKTTTRQGAGGDQI